MYLSDVFCEALREWDDDAGAFVVCPDLEKLVIDYDALKYNAGSTVFADMVEDRWRRSAEDGKFKVKIIDVLLDPGQDHYTLMEFLRLLVLKRSGLDLVIEPQNWLVDLFER